MGKPPFPAPDTLTAPPSWRCIDFVSDLHLHEGLPRTFEAFAHYLRETPADAVLILGDLFEAWVGDDMRDEPFEARCVQALRTFGQQRHLAIMVGNRDFLLGDDMLQACAAHRLADPTVLDAFGQRHLLIHGDSLCLADTAYLQFRAQVRQPAWQSAFLAAPLGARLEQARRMREASQAHQQQQGPAEWADVDEAAATHWLDAASAHTLVHGHTHRPGSEPFGGLQDDAPRWRHVTMDWELDHARPRAEVLRLSADGFTRQPVAG